MSLNVTTTRHALPQIHEEWAARRYSDSARHHFDQWTAQYPALRGYELAEIPFRVSTLPEVKLTRSYIALFRFLRMDSH